MLKLMRSLQLVCNVRRKKRYPPIGGEHGKVTRNMLNREFNADALNTKWVTDVTKFSVGDRKLYLPLINQPAPVRWPQDPTQQAGQCRWMRCVQAHFVNALMRVALVRSSVDRLMKFHSKPEKELLHDAHSRLPVPGLQGE